MQPGQVSRRTVLIGGFIELRCPYERETSEGPFPKLGHDTEVSSQRTLPGQGGVPEVAKAAPEGETSAVGHMGEQIPMGTDDGGQVQFGPQPNTAPEAHKAPESGKQPPLKEGGVPIPPVSSVQPEAPNTLLEALQSASIIKEHCTLMGAVIEKIQSMKSGLTEACTSLLTALR